jgi:hypothetical protein
MAAGLPFADGSFTPSKLRYRWGDFKPRNFTESSTGVPRGGA